MDDIIEATIDFVGEMLEFALRNIKNPQKRKWALTGFYSLITLVIVGFLLWGTVALLKEGSQTGAIVFGAVLGILLAVFGFFIIRGHKRNWKNKKEE